MQLQSVVSFARGRGQCGLDIKRWHLKVNFNGSVIALYLSLEKEGWESYPTSFPQPLALSLVSAHHSVT